jgi:sugar-specific transcriptional regulator TrmB
MRHKLRLSKGAIAVLTEGEIQVLVDLGLTFLQAKAYLALSSVGYSQTKIISKISHIARQDLYRIMASLEQLGLVEKMLRVPATYKATPIKEGVAILLQRKTEEYNNLQIETERLLNNFQKSTFKPHPLIDDPQSSQFVMVSEKKLLCKTLNEKNIVVKRSLDVAGTWESTRAALFDAELENFKNALRRGVKIRWITETHEEDKSTFKTLHALQNNPLFEIRYFVPPIPLQAAIYDEKELVMCIAIYPSPDITSICSDNSMLVRVASNYFEEVWNGSYKDYLINSLKRFDRAAAAQPVHPTQRRQI